MTPLHITLELMSHQTDRESTHHRVWWSRFVKPHSDPQGHYYIATTNEVRDRNETNPAYLPEELHSVLMSGYLENLRRFPHLARGKVDWIDEPSPHTFGIVSPNDRLPFKDSTVTRIVRYNTLPLRLSNGEGHRAEQMLLEELREAYRVLKSGKKIEFHETRSAEDEISLNFDQITRLVNRFNDEIREGFLDKRLEGVPEREWPVAREYALGDAVKLGFDTTKIKVRRYYEHVTQIGKNGRPFTIRVEKHSLMISKLH